MTRPVSFQCEPSENWCECGACELPPVRNIDLDALRSFNRAAYSLSLSLIFVAFIAAIFAAGLINANANQEKIAKTYQEVLAKW